MPIFIDLKLKTGETKSNSCLNEDLMNIPGYDKPHIKMINMHLAGYLYDDRIVKNIIDQSSDFSSQYTIELTDDIKSFDDIEDGNFKECPEPQILRKKIYEN